MKNLKINHIKCEALSGSHASDCLSDAAIMALQEGRTVKVIHNENTYIINPYKLINSLFATILEKNISNKYNNM